MVRYWVIAPYNFGRSEAFEAAWDYDRSNGVIAIGWDMGDFSSLSPEEVDAKFQEHPEWNQRDRYQVRNFCCEIQPGDVVIARGGRKKVVGIGDVTGPAFYDLEKGIERAGGVGEVFPNFRPVSWRNRGEIDFPKMVFGMQTLTEMPAEQYSELLGSDVAPVADGEGESGAGRFVLEKHLQDFIVTNFSRVFDDRLSIFVDDENNRGVEYVTDAGRIDILAWEPDANSYVVIELKRAKTSDEVVGQTLRYMGWVKEHLCTGGKSVRGLIIALDGDEKLDYAVSMTPGITLRFYRMNFQLMDSPSR